MADTLISLGYDVALGADVLDLDSRMGLPSDEVMKPLWIAPSKKVLILNL